MKNVLYLCTGNSARSILAEALTNHLEACRGKLQGFSAGSFPRGEVNPLTLELLRAEGIPVAGLRSKRWDEFAGAGSPRMDFVITVCDQAAGEVCPVFPGAPAKAHWSLPDPAAVDGSVDVRRKAFQDTYAALQSRIEQLARTMRV